MSRVRLRSRQNHTCWCFLCSVLVGTLITRTCASQEFGDQSKALIKKKIACVGVPCVCCSLCCSLSLECGRAWCSEQGVLIQDFAYLRVPTCSDRVLACTAAEKNSLMVPPRTFNHFNIVKKIIVDSSLMAWMMSISRCGKTQFSMRSEYASTS